MSLLFREFKLTLDFTGSARLSAEEQEIYHGAKEEFKNLISGCEGLELVRKVYEVMDQLVERHIAHYPIACGSGCAYCCHQMVCCTKLEMDLIVEYLGASKSREKRLIKAEAIKRSLKYHRLLQCSGYLRNTAYWEQISSVARQILYKRPCPFLRRNMCGIYPVRPPDCRSARVLEKRCGYGLTEPPQGIKFFLDQIAADVLVEEDMRLRGGGPQIVPLFGWVLSEDFKRFFR
jgi:hypothetical protein